MKHTPQEIIDNLKAEMENIRWLILQRTGGDSNHNLLQAVDALCSETIKLRNNHDKLLEACKAVLNNPIISGNSARIRDEAKQNNRPNPLDLIEQAIADTKGKDQQ